MYTNKHIFTTLACLAIALAGVFATQPAIHAHEPEQEYLEVRLHPDDDRIFLYPVPDDFPISHMTMNESEPGGLLQCLRNPAIWSASIPPLMVAAAWIACLAWKRRQAARTNPNTACSPLQQESRP